MRDFLPVLLISYSAYDLKDYFAMVGRKYVPDFEVAISELHYLYDLCQLTSGISILKYKAIANKVTHTFSCTCANRYLVKFSEIELQSLKNNLLKSKLNP